MSSRKAARLLNEPRLNKTLRRVFAGATSTRAGAPRTKPIDLDKNPSTKSLSRTEIVSEKLCDDLIAYLAPSLKPFRGCTILDVHPGACLWSRKLHEFLKPRCHILMEPDELYIKEFIKPLVQKPGSRYKHSALPFLQTTSFGATYSHPYAQALEEARGPGMQDIPTLTTSIRDYDDFRLRLLSSKLLMTGNLSRVYHKKLPQYNLAKEVICALENASIHRNGLVRQLFWVPDNPKTKAAICPPMLSGRNQTNTLMALAADVTEVAGVDLTARTANETKGSQAFLRGKNADLTLDIQRQVAGRMLAAGYHVPKGRKLLKHPEPADGKSEPGLKSPFTIDHHTIEDVSKAIDEFDTYLEAIRAGFSGDIHTEKRDIQTEKQALQGLVEGLAYPQCLSAAAQEEYENTREEDSMTYFVQRKAVYLDTTLRLINLETHAVNLRDEGIDITALKERLGILDQEIQKLMARAAETSVNSLEELILHFTTPLNLPYDRRKYEPLLASKQDFWPQAGLALYDCVPLSTDLEVEDIATRQEVTKVARQLSRLFYQTKTASVPVALEKIAPNAAQDLIPKVPEITDPRRGGRLDARNVSCRMVSEKMFEGLVRAWFEWPFKPDRYDLEIAGMREIKEMRGAPPPGVNKAEADSQ